MKYLKKYNESNYRSISDLKDLIYHKLRELKEDIDDGFNIQINDKPYTLNHIDGVEREFVKCKVMKESHFDYSQISETIEGLKKMMEIEGWSLWDYSCYLGHRPPTAKIERELNRVYNRFGDGRYTESCYSFNITFVKGDNLDSPYAYMMDMKRYQLKTNEELNPATYKSAADILKKKGHIKRPDELMKWHDISIKRQEEDNKRKKIEDVSQLGIYNFKINEYSGRFYLNIIFDEYSFEDDYRSFIGHEGNMWLPFYIGIIPVDEEGIDFCESTIKKSIGLGSDKLTYWVGEFRLHLSDINYEYLGSSEEAPHPDLGDIVDRGSVYKNSSNKKEYEWDGEKWIDFVPKLNPMGKGYFNSWDCHFSLTDRQSAIKFKNSLYKILNGEIYFGEDEKFTGGLREHVATELCEVGPFTTKEFIEVTKSILKINNNDLYKQ